jgi:hypothetical protein
VFCFGLFSSCKNKCGSTTCQNGGSCASNVCVCPKGYSGNACQSGWSDLSIGTYNCTRANCKPAERGVLTWQSAVTKAASNGGYTIYISNFDGGNTTQTGLIDSSINGVAKITISPVAGSGVNATGTFDSTTKTINLQYTNYSGGVSTGTCNMILVKE